MSKRLDYSNQSRTTGIEWCSHTWNPFVGCSIKSAGCQNCYAMNLAKKLEDWGQPSYRGTTKTVRGKTIWTGKINKATPGAFRKPLGIHEPSIIFVNSMSDFFHDKAPDRLRMEAWEIMASTPRHQYQILTKRPENVRPFLRRQGIKNVPENIWLGATVEDARVAKRVDDVRRYPSKIKFLSVEPLIAEFGKVDLTDIQWVITGGESGPGARPMDPKWLYEVHSLTRKYGVKHFFKQYGKPQNNPLFAKAEAEGLAPATYVKEKDPIGKGGSLLRGRYVKEMPSKRFQVAEYGQTG